jgi:HNH endonuclease
MSDEPPSYFVNGVELLGFRRHPNLGLFAPGEIPERKSKKKNKQPAENKRRILNIRDGNLCHYCKKVMRGPNPQSIEHVVPRSLGGSNNISNLVLACIKCNNSRGSIYIKCDCAFCKNARHIHENG